MKQSFADSWCLILGWVALASILDIKSILYKINTLESFVWRMKPDVYHEGLGDWDETRTKNEPNDLKNTSLFDQWMVSTEL